MFRKRRYRIAVETREAEGRKEVEIRPGLLAFLVLLAAGLLGMGLLGSWVVFESGRTEARYRAEIEHLRAENQAQAFHIQKFADRIECLNREMERLQNFYAKLKILADLDLEDYRDASMATGGPQAADQDLDMYLEKNLKRQIQRVHWEIEELQMLAKIQERNAYKIETFFDAKRSLLDATPTIWPVRGWITSPFGHRISPFTGTLQMHEGIDICARLGTPVRATADGVVIYSGWKSDYGKLITLDHGYGYRTRYAHLSKIYVKNGQRVKRGEIIGAVGSTGRSTGPHLHYEVKVRGLPVNPKKYLLN